jgi:hypothetical protein
MYIRQLKQKKLNKQKGKSVERKCLPEHLDTLNLYLKKLDIKRIYAPHVDDPDKLR